MNRIAHYDRTARQALRSLANDHDSPKTLHHLRTHLRRLQAYLDLSGDVRQTEILSSCVSELSPLRTLHVFEEYLKRTDARRKDIEEIRRRIAAAADKMRRRRVYENMVSRLNGLQIPPSPSAPHWLQQRLRGARHGHLEALRELMTAASKRPRRRVLHALRLRLKTIRYQEEWAAGKSRRDRTLLSQLKRAQTVLGDYEDLVQFRKLARDLSGRTRTRVKKDWRRARKKARRLASRLQAVVDRLMRHAVPRRTVSSGAPADDLRACLR
jgi:CHAD domain